MNAFNLLNLIDCLLLVVIIVVAYDAIHQLRPWRHPARSLCFVLIAIGSFGWLMYDTRDQVVPWWALMLHAGFALHSVIRFHARNFGEQDYVVRTYRASQLAAYPHRYPPKRQANPSPRRR